MIVFKALIISFACFTILIFLTDNTLRLDNVSISQWRILPKSSQTLLAKSFIERLTPFGMILFWLLVLASLPFILVVFAVWKLVK